MREYQFSFLRYVHSASSGEAMNVGLVLWDPSERRLHPILSQRYKRLSQCFADFEGPAYRQMVSSLSSRFKDLRAELESPQIDIERKGAQAFAEVLEFLMPSNSSCFRWSPPMAGIAPNPAQRATQLYQQFIARHEPKTGRQRRDEREITRSIEEHLFREGIYLRIERDIKVEGPSYDYTFAFGWRNGITNVIQPVSLDFINSSDLVDRAHTWHGRLHTLSAGKQRFCLTSVVAPPSEKSLFKPYERAIRIIEQAPHVEAVVEEKQFGAIAAKLKHQFDERFNQQ